MTKNEFLEVLIPELKRLEEEEHLRDLTRNGRYGEARAVIGGIDYSALNQYCDDFENDNEECSLEVSDIPEEYLVIFTLYLHGSPNYDEVDVMNEREELQAAVAKQGEDGAIIAEKMNDNYLNHFNTIADLMDLGDKEDAVD